MDPIDPKSAAMLIQDLQNDVIIEGGAFAEAGYAMNLEEHIAKNPELYGDIIAPLWQSVTYKGARYGVPQDSEVRMYFLNNDKLRKLGKTDKEIAAIAGTVDSGEFTAYDLCDLAGQSVTKGVTKFGILHRPNAGPDFQMMMEGFGHVPYDKAEAKLVREAVPLIIEALQGALPEAPIIAPRIRELEALYGRNL